jgi:hypothetical protein
MKCRVFASSHGPSFNLGLMLLYVQNPIESIEIMREAGWHWQRVASVAQQQEALK